jgi:hypothetical protein
MKKNTVTTELENVGIGRVKLKDIN